MREPAAGAGLEAGLAEARLAQSLTLGWMVIELGAALAAALAAGSIALAAFGLDSGIELVTAAVVLHRLLQRTSAEERGVLDPGEVRASHVVGWALYALMAVIALSALAALAFRFEPRPSIAGIALTVVSIAVMAGLWRWRLGLADRIGSPALKGDAACSLVCLYMAGATLAGLAVNQLWGWWWADPLAALALLWWIRGEAREALEAR